MSENYIIKTIFYKLTQMCIQDNSKVWEWQFLLNFQGSPLMDWRHTGWSNHWCFDDLLAIIGENA